MRLFLALLIAVFSALSQPAAWSQNDSGDWPSFGIMGLEDHKAYFREGTYSYHAPDYEMRGQFTYTRISYEEQGEETIRFGGYSAVEVYPNVLPSADQEFSKEVFDETGSATWATSRSAFVYEFTEQDIQLPGDVWLSDNDFAKVTKDDVQYGPIQSYYNQARAETDGTCCRSVEEYKSITIGLNAEQCFFIEHKHYDVKCNYRHLSTGFQHSIYYVRLEDAIG